MNIRQLVRRLFLRRCSAELEKAQRDLATVRATLAVVRAERDEGQRLLRELRSAELIPWGNLHRQVNCHVNQP